MTPRAFWTTCLLLAMPALPLHGQTPAYAATAPLDSSTEAALMHDITAAHARGLPAEPLMAKVREGRLKRASGARIRVAVAALATRLDSARAALGAGAFPSELVSAAEVLGAGGTVESIRSVRQATAMRPLDAPLGALAQLVASGVPVPKAVTMVVELLHRSVAPAYLVAFGNAVQVDAMSGLPPEQAALFRMRSIEAASMNSTNLSAGALTSPPGGTILDVRPPANTAPRRRP